MSHLSAREARQAGCHGPPPAGAFTGFHDAVADIPRAGPGGAVVPAACACERGDEGGIAGAGAVRSASGRGACARNATEAPRGRLLYPTGIPRRRHAATGNDMSHTIRSAAVRGANEAQVAAPRRTADFLPRRGSATPRAFHVPRRRTGHCCHDHRVRVQARRRTRARRGGARSARRWAVARARNRIRSREVRVGYRRGNRGFRGVACGTRPPSRPARSRSNARARPPPRWPIRPGHVNCPRFSQDHEGRDRGRVRHPPPPDRALLS